MAIQIPILKIENTLITSIQVALDDKSVIQFQKELLQKVTDTGATSVIIDITAVNLVDSFMARSLNDIAVAVRLLGSQMVIVGMHPHIAITLIEMGLTIPNAVTALDLEKGLELLKNLKTGQNNTG